MILTNAFDDALQLMMELHGRTERKGHGVPTPAHLLSVSALTLEYGGDETDAIAALLHDAIEDAGGVDAEALIARECGVEVARLVRDVSDTDVVPKPPWRARKQAYVDHLAEVDVRAIRISAADKLHNLRSLLDEYRLDGEALWRRFSAPKEDQLWVYDAYLTAFEARLRALNVTQGRVVDLVAEGRRAYRTLIGLTAS